MSAPGLPDLFVADLDDADVARLFGDVLRATTLLGLTFKDGATRMVAPEGEDPGAARGRLERLAGALAAGEAIERPHGLQLRYAFDGVVFYDTLVRKGAGWRLTRIAPPHAQPG